jgi:hypothetical protein
MGFGGRQTGESSCWIPNKFYLRDLLTRNGNEIHMIICIHMRLTGRVACYSGLFQRKRQLVLTTSPRFVYIDPEKMCVRGVISN